MQQESESDTVLEGEKQGGELPGWVALTAGEREWECEEEEEVGSQDIEPLNSLSNGRSPAFTSDVLD